MALRMFYDSFYFWKNYKMELWFIYVSIKNCILMYPLKIVYWISSHSWILTNTYEFETNTILKKLPHFPYWIPRLIIVSFLSISFLIIVFFITYEYLNHCPSTYSLTLYFWIFECIASKILLYFFLIDFRILDLYCD